MDETLINVQTSISKHALFDLSHVSPLVFLYLLRGCYAYGTCKASVKFRALQQQLYLVLLNNPQARPATLIAHCLYILLIFESCYDGFSHLVLSALRRFLKIGYNDEDILKAKICATKLFLDLIGGTLAHDDGVVIKIVQIFDVKLSDIDEVMCDPSGKRNSTADTAKQVVEKYVFKLIELQSYATAVDLLIHFSICQAGESFLLKMMECRQLKAAEKWATYVGKPTLCLLVQEYVDQKLLKPAHDIIKKNNLHQEFPELYHQSKEISLKKLAEKGVWEKAEERAKGDRKLLEYLVYLAMEAGYSEKVEELCDRYSLKGFLNFKEPESNPLHSRYLNLHELFIEDVFWVDEVNSLCDAICYFEKCKVIGVDCEWKPNYEKGSRPNKDLQVPFYATLLKLGGRFLQHLFKNIEMVHVEEALVSEWQNMGNSVNSSENLGSLDIEGARLVSIMQIASEEKVYIFDLIKLYEDVPSVLDECLARILHSPSILKLGYNFQCDVKQLAHSYRELNCFKHFEMLLDIQNVFKEPRGGLSGLAEKILGTGLNKTRRNSDWEQRPLSHHQLEYAALDAAVLLHIFRHVGNQSQAAGDPDGGAKIEWKSYIVSHLDSRKVPNKDTKLEMGLMLENVSFEVE